MGKQRVERYVVQGCGRGVTLRSGRSRAGRSPGSCGAAAGAGSAAPSGPHPVAGKGGLDRPGGVSAPFRVHTTFVCVYLCGF